MRDDPSRTRLSDVQAQLYDLITAPEGVAKRLAELGRTPDDLAQIIRPGDRLSAVERVDIYANMYFYRILDVLRGEYEKLVALVGDGAFHNIVTDYLIACRPAHPSLREVGARLPAYLGRHPLVAAQPWLSELARLERIHLELFDGPDDVVLTLDGISKIPPADLGGLTLRAIRCHTVVHNRYPISELWTLSDARDSRDTPPELSETLLVWRQASTVFHRAIARDEEALLPLLVNGCRFEIVCERLLEVVAQESVVARAYELLGRWVSDGLIAADQVLPTWRRT